MTKAQIGAIAGSVLLLIVLYFGVSKTSSEQKELEKTKALQMESTDITLLLSKASKGLSANQLANVEALQRRLDEAVVDSTRTARYRELSSLWYQYGYPVMSGYYAQQIAEIEQTEESWAITGTTYTIALQEAGDESTRAFASGRAVRAFEAAVSLNPEELSHKVNLALVYTLDPPQDNPMRGILMLRELDGAHPREPMILNNLARLAIQTRQYERAVERLETVLEVDPNNIRAICLLAEAYRSLNDDAQAADYTRRCQLLQAG